MSVMAQSVIEKHNGRRSLTKTGNLDVKIGPTMIDVVVSKHVKISSSSKPRQTVRIELV